MTVVDTALGKVRGIDERKVLAFKGIPFAAPPVGPLRLRPPQLADPWVGERDCSDFGAIAPQMQSGLEQMMGLASAPASEDCLTLNVWTPSTSGTDRPVMVWLHGGAFFSGSGRVPWYNGGGLARRGDVVVVTLNYRLGPLGFLHLGDHLGDEFASSANLGLLDQIAALEWVQQNIAGFGGNPSDVTIFGESAGGMSVGTLLAMPDARGLFRRAIAQSGAAQAVYDRDHAADQTDHFLATVGASRPDELLDMPVERLIEAEERMVGAMFQRSKQAAVRGGLAMPFQPAVDGITVPRQPLDAVRDGAAAHIPLIVGTTRDEMRLFTMLDPTLASGDEASMVELCDMVFSRSGEPGAGRAAFDSYRERRPGASPADVFTDLLGDYVFRIPAIRLAEAQRPHQEHTYMYRFSWGARSMPGAGAFHGIDILFCFDNVRMPGTGMLLGDDVEAGHSLGAAMSEAWLAFARSGDPNHGGLPPWPAYDTERRATMDFDADIEVIDDLGAEDRRLWEGVL